MPLRLPRRSDSELRVQGVAEPVAEQIDAERRERERGAWECGQPPRDVQKVAALGQHAAPGRRWRLHAEPEETDRGLRDDERRELQTRDHDEDRKSTRLNSSHSQISYAVFCLKKKTHGAASQRHLTDRQTATAGLRCHRPYRV